MTEPATTGLYFEDYAIGLELKSPGRTVTETDIVQFAGLSGDYNALHTDAEFAKETPFGQRIAHGLLTLSIASGLAARAGLIEGTVLAFLRLEWKFKKPVMIGDTVHLRVRVAKLRAMPSRHGGMVDLNVSVVNQSAEVVQIGEWRLLVKARA